MLLSEARKENKVWRIGDSNWRDEIVNTKYKVWFYFLLVLVLVVEDGNLGKQDVFKIFLIMPLLVVVRVIYGVVEACNYAKECMEKYLYMKSAPCNLDGRGTHSPKIWHH